ncbi:MAG: HAMP domain-containing sensor histidine kinase [Melioribacteraceae bacterium]|nr:HAMP domain-containing sensor histidine kinase [Melioribacteraceae bacterium]
MTDERNANTGIVIFLDREAKIKNVSYNKLDENIHTYDGELFTNIVDTGSLSKTLNFIVDIKANGAAFNWEIVLNEKLKFITCLFSGVLLEDGLLVTAAVKGEGEEKYYNGMIGINNEQTNKIRDLEQTFSKSERSSSDLFNEISKLNNELVDTQRALNKKNVELAQLNKIKNEFLGMAAHDLRNPLGNIINFSEFLLEERETYGEEQIEFLESIKARSEYMLNLVTELLDVSNIEAGSVKVVKEKVNLVKMAKDVMHLIKPTAERKNRTNIRL